jgi:transcription initiation factor TFIIIB Brf1 subunit/transcription initiation factor TFIIB
VDFGAEWRFYGADDINTTDPTRCGMPVNPLLVESSFGCKIICRQGSSYEMRKVRRYTEWQSMPYKEKSKYDDFQAINVLATNAGMPKIIIDDAIRYYNKISQVKTYRGVNRDGILASSIYISCSINEHPRTSKEIAEIFKLDNTSATRGCKNALGILNDIEKEEEDKTVLHNTKPSSFINRYCSKLSINQELTTLCLFIANVVETQKIIPENTPHSISAGIVYFVCQKCNLNISKKSIHSISKISEVTINKCFKKLEKIQEELLPAVILKKYTVL